ncbi:MAG: hypothetical protein C0613_03615 [Desulfobulbaceae bacterium]|nr:MAG: hypothetical protein C0613_03615 [Desulfobulbaceae bacterium]
MSFRLRSHLLAYVSLVTFLLTAAIVSLSANRFQEHAVRQLIDTGKIITANASFALADHLFAEHYAPLQEFVRKFSKQANVAAIEISDLDGNILAATDVDKLSGHLVANTGSVGGGEDFLVQVLPAEERLIIVTAISIEQMVLGHIRVCLDMEEMLAEVAQVRRQGILTGLLCWLVALLLGAATLKMVTRPVRRFVKVTEKISRGDFAMELPATSRVYELDKFAAALTVMTRAIAQREQSLRSSEEKFRHLFERAMEGIFVTDDTGTILDANPACAAMLGATKAGDLLGRNLFTDFFSDRQSVEPFQKKMAAQGFVQGLEPTLRTMSGTTIVAALSCHAVREETTGAILRYEGMLRDITARKEAEQEVARIRNYLNNIIESMPSMLVTVDHDSTITQWNSAAYRLSGIPSSQAIGRKIWDVAPFFQKYSSHFKEISRDRPPVKLHREQMNHGSDRIFNMTLFPLVANGTDGIAIRLDDITELETKEQQLRQAQKMESVGTLAGGLAHDFNNVLGGILGNLSLMQFRLAAGEKIEGARLQEYLDRMNSAGNRAADLVRQLLTLSRQQEIDLVPVDLNQSIRHVIKICENSLDKSVEIICRPAPAEARVLADPTQIEQVILNLCINAGHAMTIMRQNEAWGGRLSVELEVVEVDEAFRASHPEAGGTSYWRLSVQDTGVGMNTKTVSKIFDPFFTTKEQGKGTGLGLAMAYNIVKQLGGFMDVYSEEGMGSTFTVYLPQLTVEAQPVAPVERPEVPRGQGTILVVDDDDLIRSTATEILQSLGYTVLTAKNGREAVDVYRQQQHAVSAVLLDMVMPVMSGREAYVEMKKINSQVKVLLVSGFRKDSRIDEVLALGVRKFLQKPYTIQKLATALQEVIAD